MCKECEIKPVYEFTNKKKLCKNCFISWFQKKFLYTIRTFNMISHSDILLFKNKGNFRDVVLMSLFNDLNKNAFWKIVFKGKNTKEVDSSSCDVISEKILSSFFLKGKVFSFNSKLVTPLFLFLDKEILIYAQIKKLSYSKLIKKSDKYSLLLDSLEKKHPEIKQSIVRGFLKISV